jgi:cytochrome b6
MVGRLKWLGDRRWLGDLWTWLDARVGLSYVQQIAKKKDVPVHRHTIWYYLGGMTLFLFMVQVATGVLLLFYYRPSAEEAYESIQFLMAEVEFGWLVRSIHAWAANLMIFTVFVHLFSVLLLKAYRPPREITWISGVTRVGTEIIGVVPLVGSFMLELLRGGPDVSGATLTRFYAIHVALLPAAAALFLGLHLFLVQKHGMSIPGGAEVNDPPRRSMPFFPNFLLRDLIGWLSAFAILAAMAAFFPAELGVKADPFQPAPVGIKPEWYFMFMFQSLKYLPAHILFLEGEAVGVFAFGIAGVLLLLVPFLDRREIRGERERLFVWLGIAAIVYIIVLTILGYTASPTQ